MIAGRHHKLKAGALFYALAISVIIGMITAGAIAAAYYHRLLLHTDAVQLALARNAESGVVYACAMPAQEHYRVDLFGREKDSVNIMRKAWGVYDVIEAHAYASKHSCTRYALVGAISADEAYALWLADLDRPLKLTGHTVLKGKCSLPRQGAERAYIEGRSFSGTELVQGPTVAASRFLPEANTQRVKQLLTIGNTSETDSVVHWNEFAPGTAYHRSFSAARLVLHSNGAIIISDATLAGHIVITSRKKITVMRSAQLEQLILCAPEIAFSNDAVVSVQAIASDSITVGEGAHLLYPSALVLINEKEGPDSCGIKIEKDSRISGDVLLAPKQHNMQTIGQLLIEQNAVVAGHIYSLLPVDLKGSVYGSVTCQKFVLRTNSAVYDNCLMDAVIDRSAVSPAYLRSFLFTTPAADVIQWLD